MTLKEKCRRVKAQLAEGEQRLNEAPQEIAALKTQNGSLLERNHIISIELQRLRVNVHQLSVGGKANEDAGSPTNAMRRDFRFCEGNQELTYNY